MLWLSSGRGVFPSDAPQHQPFGRCDAKINGNHGLFNRFANLVFIKLTHGKAEQCIGHATYLIPKEGLAGDLEADQAASIHPWFGFKHGSNRIFSFFQTCKVSGIVGAHKEVQPAAERLMSGSTQNSMASNL